MAARETPLYEHRQTGWPMLLCALLPLACLAWWTTAMPFDRRVPSGLVPGVCCVVAGILLAFSSLSVRVTTRELALRFGFGIYRRSIPLDSIRHVALAGSRWYEGWGVRFTRAGMLYNVAGFDAVRIDLADGRSLRIGSDEAGRLRSAVQRALDERSPRASR